jgi:hypothetical protein
MSPKNWAWEYFHTDNEKYLTNKSHPRAWCLACIHCQVRQQRDSDTEAFRTGYLAKARSDEQLFQDGMSILWYDNQNI